MKCNVCEKEMTDGEWHCCNPKPTEPSTQDLIEGFNNYIDGYVSYPIVKKYLKCAADRLQSLEAENANLQKAVESVREDYKHFLYETQNYMKDNHGILQARVGNFRTFFEKALKQLDATKEAK